MGADLCVPESDQPPAFEPLRVTADQVSQLEHWIDAANEKLQPLTSFILPGGSAVAAQLHVARTVCRRSEIEVLRLAAIEPINPQVVIYLNRLSDLLFVLARCANRDNGAMMCFGFPARIGNPRKGCKNFGRSNHGPRISESKSEPTERSEQTESSGQFEISATIRYRPEMGFANISCRLVIVRLFLGLHPVGLGETDRRLESQNRAIPDGQSALVVLSAFVRGFGHETDGHAG